MRAMKKVAILQSNYIPWKGYFDLIAAVDEFILYDDMQYTRRDWRNRNRIKTPQGLLWLTVPVRSKGNYYQKIRDVELAGMGFAKDHWASLAQHYRRAPYFREISTWLMPLYLERVYTHLSELNEVFLRAVCQYLEIGTKISHSWDYGLVEGKTERLADLCRQAMADEYLSGPAARDYIVSAVFEDAQINLVWFDYEGYAPYPQLWGEFCHNVSILDLLFNCGPDSGKYLRYTRAGLSARQASA